MIVIDEARPYVFCGRRIVSAHMMSTLTGEEGTRELLAFGERIGQRAVWLQHRGQAEEHFDVFGSRYRLALDAGAVQITAREMVKLRRWKRGQPALAGGLL